ncbi:hypothetical protein [Nodularia sp. NIES-3585]|uniref:hypothetical protein n=1 Tax=Nodularia sp. NIES-3585 TaxID=1973477 RepID=UPI000B5CB2CF|nr:hypothetical protein [Nodularia sp. NIES-3585]GAX36225.1 hypothetical protein NIES3585_22510 [Nodularia sp. NIES-3585]
MSKQINSWDLLVDLSTEEQQLLSGGQDTPGGVEEDLEEPDEETFENGDFPIPEDRNDLGEERPINGRRRR